MTYSAGSNGYGGMWSEDAHGTARWMDETEAGAIGLFRQTDRSILIGQNQQGHPAFLNQDGHIIVVAPSRAGKGIGFVQPNLLTYQGSLVVTDPKGENAAVSWRHRKTVLNQDVIILDPAKKLAGLGPSNRIPTHRFNPLSCFERGDDTRRVDDIERIADALLVIDDNDRERHWRDGAKSYLKAMLTYLAYFVPDAERTLIKLSRIANGLDIQRDDLFMALAHNQHPVAAMRDVIARSGAWWTNTNLGERMSFVSMALRSINWLNSPVWTEHLSRNDFVPERLTSRKTTVYIVCPFEKLEDYAPWFRLVISSCLLGIVRNPSQTQVPTLFMLDEYAAAVGRLPILEQAIPYIQGMGGRFAFIFQSLAQMQKLWPEPEWHNVFANAGAHIFFNVSDQKTSEYVSTFMAKNGAPAPSSGGMNFIQRDLLTPDEIRTMKPTDMIAFVRGYRPAWLSKINVCRHPDLSKYMDANPMYTLAPASRPSLPPPPAPLLSLSQALQAANKTTQTPAPSVPKPPSPAPVPPSSVAQRLPPNTVPTKTSILPALMKKYPGKKLEIQGSIVGYCDLRTDPKTGKQITVFVPLAHESLI